MTVGKAVENLNVTWIKLSDFKGNTIWPGTVFRFPAKHPFELLVGFMLF